MNRFTINKLIALAVTLLSLGSVSAQIVNKGVLKIEDGTTVYFGDDYSNESGATHTNEGNLHLEADFNNDGTVNASSDADAANGITYFDSSTQARQEITGSNVVFENMTVNNTATGGEGVLVEDGLSLTVEKGVVLTDGDLRLEGGAQLIQLHTATNSNSGSGKLLKDQQGTNDSKLYNYWSSPVSTGSGMYSVGAVLYDGTDASLNKFTPQMPTYSNGGNIISWETDPAWDGTPAILDGSGNVTTPSTIVNYWISGLYDFGWQRIKNNTPIEVGLGYHMKGNGASSTQNWTFKGSPNDGNITLTKTVDSYVSGEPIFVGNPYPSALDADSFINENMNGTDKLTGTLYFWEHWSAVSHAYFDFNGGYATYTLAGGVAASATMGDDIGAVKVTPALHYKIPVAQGFFVESTASTVGSYQVVFNNSMRTFQEKSGSTSHMYRNENVEDVTPRIRLTYTSANEVYSRPVMVAFIPNSTNGVDYGYDGKMNGSYLEDLYWVLDNKKYVINARPFDIDSQIALGMKVVNAGTHKIALSDLENFEEDVYVLDVQTGLTHDLREGDFEVSLDEGVYNSRFKLVFKPLSTAGYQEVIAESVNVYFAPNSKNIVIDNFDNLSIKGAKIYNSIGQLIKEVSKDKLGEDKITVPFNVATGAYYITIETTIGKANFKVAAY